MPPEKDVVSIQVLSVVIWSNVFISSVGLHAGKL